MTTPKISSTTSAPRKSQFNTLRQEVDSALSVVYRELEGIPLLREKISDLESGLARVYQESNIQRNELALSRRVVERARMAEDELQRLRAEATKRRAYTKEITILKVKKQELESEVTDLRSELESPPQPCKSENKSCLQCSVTEPFVEHFPNIVRPKIN
ncbi:hypothetical protein BDV39DRAFT_718 [Aspergillus sergii]|uniref:Uncharacterized protein n=1 Tax=Aspergillus sergii TaxID=1034303 RepID=A0A5N6XKE4_9EURO|nr:hypothetical protein BDV39DRAFT_718 [Aspergillus sergii]